MSQKKEFSKEELSEIEKFAYAQLSLEEIATVLEVDATTFIELALKIENPVKKAYQRGRLRAKADLNTSIITAAAAGSTPAQTLARRLIDKHDAEVDKYNEAS